jgi:hypothetical protein
MPNNPNTFFATCFADTKLRAFDISTGQVMLANSFTPKGATGILFGVSFFPNDAQSHALIAS